MRKTHGTKPIRAGAALLLSGALLWTGTAPAHADEVRDGQMTWPLRAFSVDKLWKVSTGKGVVVAVIDSGVDARHPDLAGQVLPGRDFRTGGDAREDSDPERHGTAMAGIIAGKGHGAGNASGIIGLAPDARILPVSNDADGNRDALPDAIRYAVDHGADVVNMSVGSTFPSGSALTEAIAYAQEKDVLLVAGAGNDGADQLLSPAVEAGVLAVGGVNADLRHWPDSNRGPQVMLAAPADQIVTAGTSSPLQYVQGKGTSHATAYVSAAAALVRAKYPDLTAGQVANRLVKTALVPDELKGRPLPDPRYGYGIIRPYRALTADIPKGSALGPLKRADNADTAADPADPAGSAPASDPTTPDPQTTDAGSPAPAASGEGGSGGPTAAVVLAVGGTVLLALLTGTLLLVTRRRDRRAAATAFAPPGHPPYPGHTPPPPPPGYGPTPGGGAPY